MIIRRSESARPVLRHNVHVMQPSTVSGRGTASAVAAIVRLAGALAGIAVLVAVVRAVGLAGAVLVGCVLASFAVVVLTVLRRRPIDLG